LNYITLFIKLSFIIIVSETIVMISFSYIDTLFYVSSFVKDIADSFLLLIISFYPTYKYIYKPIFNDYIKKSEEIEMLAEALRGAGDSVIITNAKGEIMYVNKSFSDVTGYSFEEVVGRNPKFLQSKRQDKEFYKNMWDDILNKGEWKGELWNKKKNGDIYPEQLDIRAIKDEKSKELKFFVGVFTDISEKKEIEEALFQSQKLEAVGTLVGGVAHNFNNLLAAISGKAYLAAKNNDTERKNKLLKDIQDLSNESATLIKQLLAFAREADHNKKVFNFSKMIKESVDTANMGISKRISLSSNLIDEDIFVFGDSVHVKQSILNIINNARDAVLNNDGDRNIEVSMFLTKELKRFDVVDKEKNNEWVKLSIKDNGSGISKKVKERIFEPFFTTKKGNLGTGLGLSTAIGTIQDHNGMIKVFSEEGKGTEFLIVLPTTAKEENEDENVKENSILKSNTKSTILVVDDEKVVQDVIVEIVEELGYKTIKADNGKQALELYEKNKDNIDILLTDIIMPVMDGAELILNIREDDDNIPVVAMTGYDVDGTMKSKNIVTNEHTVVIQKPVNISVLSRYLRKLLSSVNLKDI